MQGAPDEDTWQPYRAETQLSWWAEYQGVIRTAFAVTLIIVVATVAVRHGWLP